VITAEVMLYEHDRPLDPTKIGTHLFAAMPRVHDLAYLTMPDGAAIYGVVRSVQHFATRRDGIGHQADPLVTIHVAQGLQSVA
jgi:hypothetical protein